MKNSTQVTLADNVRYLLGKMNWSEAELGRRAGVSQKTVNNVVRLEKSTKIETADAIAKPFGLEGWQLFLPNLRNDYETGGTISKLFVDYLSASQQGQQHILWVAEREAQYNTR